MEPELAKKILDSGIKKSKIEADLDMPQNSLSSMITGTRATPIRWSIALGEYLDKNKKEFGFTASDGSSGTLKETPDAFKVKVVELDFQEQTNIRIINQYCEEIGSSPAQLIREHMEYRERQKERAELWAKIEEIKKETIPKERNTSLGAPIWKNDQAKKIQGIKEALAQ